VVRGAYYRYLCPHWTGDGGREVSLMGRGGLRWEGVSLGRGGGMCFGGHGAACVRKSFGLFGLKHA
jgi:hypothetical protein